MRAWFIYFLLFLNAFFALANLYFGVTGYPINLIFFAVNVVGAGLMFKVLSTEGWPHPSERLD